MYSLVVLFALLFIHFGLCVSLSFPHYVMDNLIYWQIALFKGSLYSSRLGFKDLLQLSN